jgi:hypothetical protein
MGRTTKSLSGGGKDKLLRALVGREIEIATVPAERLLQRLSEALTEVRVKRDVWEMVAKADEAQPKAITPNKTGRATRAVSSTATPKVVAAKLADTAAPDTVSTAFDPFAFSALAILTRKGKAGLATVLAEINTAEHLHALAAAQHLTVDRAETDLTKLRDAIITATEARLKERRAAAS